MSKSRTRFGVRTATAACAVLLGYSGVSSKKYVMIAQSNLGVMSFKTYHSTSVTGPWSEGPSARVPQEGCTGPPLDSCYAIKGHPELSTSAQLLYSWYSPDDRDGFGHIRIGAIR